jgi:S-formylglutathione hydrolase FrmB
MTGPSRQPTRHQIRRRRLVALGLLIVTALATYLVLAAAVFSPGTVPRQGNQVEQLTIDSKAVGQELGVNVVVPAGQREPRGKRPLLVFLHGRGGSDGTFVNNESVFQGLKALGPKAPIVAFPDGGEHGYWHDRPEADWAQWVMREVIPTVQRRFGTDPHRIAIGGISMGGFGAYDLALHHPGRFCAVGGHSPALWFHAGETAPGAFEDAADFRRNDVVGTVERDPDAFGETRVWNDYGSEDPFRPYDEGFVAAMERGDADFTTHTSPGGHDNAYWNPHWAQYLRFYANSLARCG